MFKKLKHAFAVAMAFLFSFAARAEGDLTWADAADSATSIKTAIMSWASNVVGMIAPLVIAGLVFWGLFALVRILKRSFNSGRR